MPGCGGGGRGVEHPQDVAEGNAVSQRHANHRHEGDDWVPLEEVITKDIFKAEVHTWAGRIGVEVKALHLRRMTRKWGSCSTAGLMFNADLLSTSGEVREEVIVHELSHLKVPNHGQVLRALLRAYLGREDTTREMNRPH
jgi:predicted metal-dependent hydrolase